MVEIESSFLSFDSILTRFEIRHKQGVLEYEEIVEWLEAQGGQNIPVLLGNLLRKIVRFDCSLLTPCVMKGVVELVANAWRDCKMQLNLEQAIILLETAILVKTDTSQDFLSQLLELFHRKVVEFKADPPIDESPEIARRCLYHIFYIE